MSLITATTTVIERLPLPDTVTRAGIAFLVGRTRRKLAREGATSDTDFARLMARHPIAVRPDAANAQHYEVSADFFGLVLGPRRKYSCCLYRTPADTLAQAEEAALVRNRRPRRPRRRPGHPGTRLRLGLAEPLDGERYPAARITAVSNSHRPARLYRITRRRRRPDQPARHHRRHERLSAPDRTFDRVVSVEMFEHMTNWQSLLGRVRTWLRPDGRLFLHVFSHRTAPYRFDAGDKQDWIAQHFFTGGIMPSHGLIRHVTETFDVEADWRWSGEHYARTARDWLANFDRNDEAVTAVLQDVYGAEAALWKRRWRLFFLATAGLFGHADGTEWGVSHYRLRPR